MNKLKIVSNIIFALIMLWVGFLTYYTFKKPVIIKQEVDVLTLYSKNENEIISDMILNGHESKVYDFYDNMVNNKRLTYLIVSNALSHNIPVNIFMSLAYTESKFKINALNYNKDKHGKVLSIDYSVFQLNSKTFKMYDKEYLMNIENNVRLAADHLSLCYAKYGNWYEAILSYNAGGTDLVRNKTVKHLVSVLAMNENLRDKFKVVF